MAKKKKRKGKASASASVTADVPAAAQSPGGAAAEDAAGSVSRQPSASPRGSALARAFILIVLGYELLMPLRYYLGGRGYDERFSWRMFSTVRLQKCRVEVNDQLGRGDDAIDRAVQLGQVLQVAWVGMLERYRKPVVEKLLRRRCEQKDVNLARFERRCTDTDGTEMPSIEVVLDCKSLAFKTSEGAP